MNIAVIPARGGSKRIPRKNIRTFCGKPMIAWSIEAARQCGLFSRVVVSTDDAEIADIAREHGAEAPFTRPAELSNDLTPTAPVIGHALSTLGYGHATQHACCIYPCAPLINQSDLVATFDIASATSAKFVYPVVHYPHPVQRAMRRLSDGRMEFLAPQFELTRTQDLEPTFHDAGQFYWGTAEAWTEGLRMHTDGVGFPIPGWRVVDIDTIEDWERAELLFQTFASKA